MLLKPFHDIAVVLKVQLFFVTKGSSTRFLHIFHNTEAVAFNRTIKFLIASKHLFIELIAFIGHGNRGSRNLLQKRALAALYYAVV